MDRSIVGIICVMVVLIKYIETQSSRLSIWICDKTYERVLSEVKRMEVDAIGELFN